MGGSLQRPQMSALEGRLPQTGKVRGSGGASHRGLGWGRGLLYIAYYITGLIIYIYIYIYIGLLITFGIFPLKCNASEKIVFVHSTFGKQDFGHWQLLNSKHIHHHIC